ncbi:tetratricopeptide repeat protein, partial [bacterium]
RDKAGESVCYGNLGVAYYSLGDFKKAIEFLENSLKIKKEIGDKAGESACYTNLGIAYQSLGDSRKAIEFPEN